ncbi:MAG: acetylornithine aminotransferase [Candidatus Binatia bacterium]|nr:MAG: acetylornithine aminotransferase [Candidatus Binatia bacterium]
MTHSDIVERSDRYLFAVYRRAPVALVQGRGCRVWDADGKPYLDFFASTIVASLGHCHPRVVEALRVQSEKILHVSNLHYSEPAARLAELLCRNSFADRVFFCNSGAEANEAAIKLARAYGRAERGGRYEILTATGSFHGRTLATLAATGQEKVRAGFEPLPDGFRYVPYDRPELLEEAIGERTVAVLLEPVQGEGGVVVPRPDYLGRVREICDRHGLLLMLDEVQTGMGRLGHLFGHEMAGVRPDVVTLAKGLGGGVPIGAMLATEKVARAWLPGAHGSTFGGNALACAAACAVVEELLGGEVLENCRRVGEDLRNLLGDRIGGDPRVREIRGAGLLVGVELTVPGDGLVESCRRLGLLLNCTAEKVLRLCPPLVVSREEVEEAVEILARALAELEEP